MLTLRYPRDFSGVHALTDGEFLLRAWGIEAGDDAGGDQAECLSAAPPVCHASLHHAEVAHD